MCKKLIFLTSFVLVLSLVSSNAVLGQITIERRIISGNDDTEAIVGGGADRGSSDLEMPYEGDGATDNKQIIGLRFQDIPLEKGEQVTGAYIQFTGDDQKLAGDTVNLIINGLLQLNPVEFGSDEQFYDDRNPKTTAEVKWSNIPDWSSSIATEESKTPNIASVINEIISQDGWAKGDALIIAIRDDETNPSTDIRSALANSARLILEIAVAYATNPIPADGVIIDDTWVNLMWSPGNSAVSHDVYLSDNSADVEAGAESAFLGNQASAALIAGFPGMPYPEGLTPGATYYWRIDEVEADGTKIASNVWSFTVPSKTAYNPSPADGSKYIDTEVQLNWTAGFGAIMHTIYFSDNFDDVNNAAGGIPMPVTTYTPGTLEMDKTYYWRVDAFSGATHKGDVWSFKTLPIIAITDPNLIGYWKFDEASGDTAIDFSGYGNEAQLGGDPERVEGFIGGALDLDGDDYVMIDDVVDDITSNDITLSAWIRTTQVGEGNVIASNDGGSHVLQFGIDGGNVWVDDGPSADFPPTINDDQWHMITLVMKGSQISIYTDGIQVGAITTSIDITTETRWSIGQEWDGSSPSDLYIGLVDEVRFYDSALTEDQVQELMRGDPLLAWNPNPKNKSTADFKEASKPISWSAGDAAAEHDVYFGTDKDAVSNADASDTTGIYLGRQGGTSLTLPAGSTEWGGGPYYWRVDENNNDGSVSTGSVWSYSVADYLVVDDFESYNDLNTDEPDSKRIFYSWLDGFDNPATNGSVVGYASPPFAEQGNVHSGMQAMPLFYDNGVGISEATLTLVDQKNWTEEGVGSLTIWFRGEAANAVVPLFVAVNGNAVVTHSNLTASQIDTWTEWTIDLQLFADQGVNLSNVNTISLGLGNKSNPIAGGTGTMYFDDIRLYKPAP
ncbi:MAG: LamG domain-containing protein [Planctomycetes bacterium]|nr:LamG domain-containing protein [Planctomycetota bacterium]